MKKEPPRPITKKSLRTCGNGHQYYKSSDCPVCPVCEEERKPKDHFLSMVSAPSRRALENENITTLFALSQKTETYLLSLHGIGPSTIPKLKAALAQSGLTLANK